MAKTKKVTLDVADGNYVGSKGTEIVTIYGGKHDITPKSGNDKIIVDVPDSIKNGTATEDEYSNTILPGQVQIADSVIHIGKGQGNVTISLTEKYLRNNYADFYSNTNTPAYMPQIEFEYGAKYSYSIVAKNKNSYSKEAIKLLKDVLAGKRTYEEYETALGEFLEHNLVITAKWGKKTSSVTIEDYFKFDDCMSVNGAFVKKPSTEILGSLIYGDTLKKVFAKEMITLEFDAKSISLSKDYYKYLKKATSKEIVNINQSLEDKINEIKDDTTLTSIQKTDAIEDAQENANISIMKLNRNLTQAKYFKNLYFGGVPRALNNFNITGNSIVYATEGKNYFNVGKKVKFAQIVSGQQNDDFKINNLNSLVALSDEGSNHNAGNNITITNANANDFHTVFMYDDLGDTDDEFIENISDMLFQNSKGIDSFKKMNLNILNPNFDESFKVKGINLHGGNGLFGDDAFVNSKSQIWIGNDKSKSAGMINYDDLVGALKSQYNLVGLWAYQNEDWLIKYCDGSYSRLMQSGESFINELCTLYNITGQKQKKRV